MMLFETIQILNGKPQRLRYHNQRFNRSRQALFCTEELLFLEQYIQIPAEFSYGFLKCKIIYDASVVDIEFTKYQPRKINRFYLVETELNYDYKFLDRSDFEQLKTNYPSDSELILVKNGLITDTTYSNLIFKDLQGNWVTPLKPLLIGTQREFLLDAGQIAEKPISPSDLKQQYSHFMLINAMLPFNESREIPVELIENL
jgi:4-amino-4-deoxychorismate lyase